MNPKSPYFSLFTDHFSLLMVRYDLCVIGAGPAGYAAAMRAVDFGKRVLLIEKDKLGGAGLHNGALSSKTFWEISQDLARWRKQNAHFGLPGVQVPFADIVAQVHVAVNERMLQLSRHIEGCNDCELHADIHYVKGQAFLESNHHIRVDSKQGPQHFEAEFVILATGSRPRLLPHIQVDEQIILSSDGVGNLKDYPESIVVLGAGVIGCEFATIFASLGRTKVYLIDKADRILPFEDADIVTIVEKNLEANGATIHRHASLLRMEIKEGRVEYELRYSDGRQEIFNVEKALIAVGREPNTEGLGLENTDVQLTDRGHILELAKDTRTTAANIFAVGDITADIALVNVGELEGRFAVETMFGYAHKDLCYDNISTIMFLEPEVAGVGMNEIQAQCAGLCYRVATWNYDCIPRAIAMRQTEGFFKILVTDDAEMRILGMRAIGQDASSAIQAVALLICMGKGIHELAEMVHPHPSITEGVQECVRMLLGKSIFKPQAFKQLKCLRWEGGCYSEA
jgi:dihydrolipoamide dehydrogenase